MPISNVTFSSSHLILVVDNGSCIQQSLNCLYMSVLSSYHQRNTAILYERVSEKRREKTCIMNRKTKPPSHNTEEIPVCTCMVSSFTFFCSTSTCEHVLLVLPHVLGTWSMILVLWLPFIINSADLPFFTSLIIHMATVVAHEVE